MSLNLNTMRLNAEQGAYGIIGSPHVLVLIEAVEALAEERKPHHDLPAFYHWESTEVSCVCGFITDEEDYTKATKDLRDHIRYHERKSAQKLKAIKDRADKALEFFNFS